MTIEETVMTTVFGMLATTFSLLPTLYGLFNTFHNAHRKYVDEIFAGLVSTILWQFMFTTAFIFVVNIFDGITGGVYPSAKSMLSNFWTYSNPTSGGGIRELEKSKEALWSLIVNFRTVLQSVLAWTYLAMLITVISFFSYNEKRLYLLTRRTGFLSMVKVGVFSFITLFLMQFYLTIGSSSMYLPNNKSIHNWVQDYYKEAARTVGG
ncbi:MAG: hypothetical protein OIF32_11320 [Campylobacterales bacterium]|nr:hypothetical protein [Campylobacterales bacterium]